MTLWEFWQRWMEEPVCQVQRQLHRVLQGRPRGQVPISIDFFLPFQNALFFFRREIRNQFFLFKKTTTTYYLPAVRAFNTGHVLDLSIISVFWLTMRGNLPDPIALSHHLSPQWTPNCVWQWPRLITVCWHWPEDFSEPGIMKMTAGTSQGSADAEWHMHTFLFLFLWYQFIRVNRIDRCIVCGKADNFCFIFSL